VGELKVKAKSDMVFHLKYVYPLDVTEKIFYFMKGRPDQLMWIDYVSVYNPTVNNYTHLYLLCRDRGVVSRCDYQANCNTLMVRKFTPDHYLLDGEELGVAVTGTATSDIIEVTVHGLRMKDEDYFKAT
jgi:hypothetical protein